MEEVSKNFQDLIIDIEGAKCAQKGQI